MKDSSAFSELPPTLQSHLTKTLAEHGLPEKDEYASVVLCQAYMSEVIAKRQRVRLIWLGFLVAIILAVAAYFYGHSEGWKDAVAAYPHTVLTTTEVISAKLADLNQTLTRLDQTLAKAEKQTR